MGSNSTESDERRTGPRVLARMSVLLRDLSFPEETFEEETRDISEGGVFIETAVELALGTPLQIEVRFNNMFAPQVFDGEIIRIETTMEHEGPQGRRLVEGFAVRFRAGQSRAVKRWLDRAQKGVT